MIINIHGIVAIVVGLQRTAKNPRYVMNDGQARELIERVTKTVEEDLNASLGDAVADAVESRLVTELEKYRT